MKERLVELLENTSQCIEDQDSLMEAIADYLLENGVIVPPCKVGDKVYVIHNTVERIVLGLTDCIYETVVDAIHISGTVEYHINYKKIVHPDCDFFTEKDIGKTVFFKRAEAVAKLKEGVTSEVNE